MPPICVVEGLPGSGKTSLCSTIVARPSFDAWQSVPEFLPDVAGDPSDTSYYTSLELAKSRLFNEAKSPLICDRYWYSTAIYCTAMATGRLLSHVEAIREILYSNAMLYENYYLIYLRIPPRMSRARAHKPSLSNDWLAPSFCERAFALYELAFDHAEELEPGLLGKLAIDAEHYAAPDVATIAAQFLGSKQ